MRTMWLGIHLECVEGSPRVSGDCKDGAREFTGRRPRLARRLSGVAEKLAGSWEETRHGPKIKLRHKAKVWTMRWELAESSLGLHRRYREVR
ncbi:hypothetical protein B296_00044329 [Ensete ventricosum]|uniref:Uncharacterized protein n=1 Tax=Ensete ventricosum TaxID=4639 RepID=A0A426XVW9_ENSVE|nr:hypothetical protein B296_00044329 [Ensete ventricosum]